MPRFFEQVEALIRKAKNHYVVKSIAITNAYMCFRTPFILVVLFHTLACGWIYIGNLPGITGWKDAFLKADDTATSGVIYTTAIYFVSTTATTIGYGDIHATNEIEKLFVTLLQLVGIFIFSYITGNVRKIKKEPNL